MSNSFWEGETYAIIKAMKATGNRPGIIAGWKNALEHWANTIDPTNGDRAAVRAWLPLWQPRPFYTAEELAPMWPALAIAIGFTNRWPEVLKSPQRLAFELDYGGLPRCTSGLGQWGKYFIVEQIHRWQQARGGDIEREFYAYRG